MGLAEDFEEIIRRMDETSHGSDSWKEAARFFQERFGRSKKRLDFLKDRLLRPPVYWEDAREELWPEDPTKQNNNRFPFLQGDIITTSLVASWVSQHGEQVKIFGIERAEHPHWLVLSPDCDAVRCSFARVAPIFDVERIDDYLSVAVSLKSPHLFPLPPIDGDPERIVGRYADLSRLFLLDCRHGRGFLPTRIASLTEAGWHMLNAQLIHQISRAEEKADAIKLRNFVSPA